MTLEKLIFYYVDGGSFLKIYDKRKSDDIKIYDLNEKERDVFLLCLDIISFQDLQNKIHIDSQELKHILVDFEDNGIIFRENDRYLSLPLSYSISLGSFSKNEHVYSISLPRQEIVF